jgi:hypothetical protein
LKAQSEATTSGASFAHNRCDACVYHKNDNSSITEGAESSQMGLKPRRPKAAVCYCRCDLASD